MRTRISAIPCENRSTFLPRNPIETQSGRKPLLFHVRQGFNSQPPSVGEPTQAMPAVDTFRIRVAQPFSQPVVWLECFRHVGQPLQDSFFLVNFQRLRFRCSLSCLVSVLSPVSFPAKANTIVQMRHVMRMSVVPGSIAIRFAALLFDVFEHDWMPFTKCFMWTNSV